MAQEVIFSADRNNHPGRNLTSEIMELPESEFWRLVSLRLNIPSLSLSRDHVEVVPTIIEEKGREHWTENFLFEEVLLKLASTKILVRHDNDMTYVSVYKYYNQALRLRNWIPISKPVPEFIVNISDLNTRIITELKALGKDGCQDILKQAVGWIFSNIDSRQYNLSIAHSQSTFYHDL